MSSSVEKNMNHLRMIDPDLKRTPDLDSATIKLSYSPHLLKARVHFTIGDCQKFPAPPEDLFARARKRMDEAKANKEIHFYRVYQNLLTETWTALREWALTQDSIQDRTITMTIAQGTPPLKGLDIKATGDPSTPITVSINAPPKSVHEWRLEWVQLYAEKVLKTDDDLLNLAQLRGALFRAAHGLPVANVHIHSLNEFLKLPQNADGFTIMHNRTRGEVTAVISNIAAIGDLSTVEKRLQSIEDKLQKLKARTKGQYHFFRREISESLSHAVEGPECFGLHLPFAILCAIDIKSSTGERVSAAPVRKPTSLKFEVAPDRLSASVVGIEEGFFEKQIPVDSRWVAEEAKNAGITHGVKEEFLHAILAKMELKESPAGLPIAAGDAPVPGTDPYLCDIKSGNLETPTAIEGDMRQYRANIIVKAGQLVAEVRFKENGVSGKDVTGQPIAPVPADFQPIVGEGIEKRDDGRYYAAFDGLFVNDPAEGIYLKKTLTHQGDVNLASGNILFDGPVEITGNIDSGAKVVVSGDLTVTGEIRGGQVICGGNIKVARGIVMGENGKVSAKGDIQADFVENSTITCGGTLVVEKSIMAARITAGKGVEIIGSSGVICGGSILAGEFVKTGKLGLRDGAKTQVTVGVAIKTEISLQHRTKRLQLLTKVYDGEKAQLKELTRKKAAQLTKAHKQSKERLMPRIAKLRKLLEMTQNQIDALDKKRHGTAGAKILVSGTLSQNCLLKVSTTTIPLQAEWNGVIVSATPAEDGSYIVPATSFEVKATASTKTEKEAG